MTLSENIDNKIKEAMKNKDSVSLESLRAIKSSILIFNTKKGGSGDLSKNDEMSFKFVSNNESSIDVPNKSLKNLSLIRVLHKLITDLFIASSFFLSLIHI